MDRLTLRTVTSNCVLSLTLRKYFKYVIFVEATFFPSEFESTDSAYPDQMKKEVVPRRNFPPFSTLFLMAFRIRMSFPPPRSLTNLSSSASSSAPSRCWEDGGQRAKIFREGKWSKARQIAELESWNPTMYKQGKKGPRGGGCRKRERAEERRGFSRQRYRMKGCESHGKRVHCERPLGTPSSFFPLPLYFRLHIDESNWTVERLAIGKIGHRVIPRIHKEKAGYSRQSISPPVACFFFFFSSCSMDSCECKLVV
ncbi:hypothetical protein IE53DRAFT_121271 [Violaceomyces palustris]|uniref:Uncharacterized protein n=1 Tax=Violaceomyces palustris TaxID=1673888 RepID=A0ACD0P6I3_9BASI|nr:hypothetical protein IE53DRAFT_121271 [Violaceomyces palustris]